MTKVQQQVREILNSLSESVNAALEKKELLGQYAVVWEKGKITYLFNDKDKKST